MEIKNIIANNLIELRKEHKLTQAEFASKLKYYEQNYFSNDEPVPFVGDLKIYPVTVKDYYKF